MNSLYALTLKKSDLAPDFVMHLSNLLRYTVYEGQNQTVKLDQEVHTLIWPNGADFDPATLHDWPRYQEALIQRAKTWEQVSA